MSDGRNYTSEQQFAPIFRHGPAIARRYGIVFRYLHLEVARKLAPKALEAYAAIGLKLDFNTPANDARACAEQLFGAAHATGARTLVFDGDDDLSVLWPDVIALCDRYLKKQVYADAGQYARTMAGKSNLTDYTHKEFGRSFENNIIPRSGGLEPAQIEKIQIGWNIALDDKIYDLSRYFPSADADAKDIDIICRASVGEKVWTFPMRDAAIRAIHSMGDKYRVLAPTDRVPSGTYYHEMRRSRISVSPFGFGEICWRDFESILCGTLLVKPDMSHVATAPDLFVPGETYIPVAWDYSDLEAVCDRYLTDEAERREIADRACKRLRIALTEDWFLDRIEFIVGGFLPER